MLSVLMIILSAVLFSENKVSNADDVNGYGYTIVGAEDFSSGRNAEGDLLSLLF
jgi:hypothetical protein